jgi:hypothetical protein
VRYGSPAFRLWLLTPPVAFGLSVPLSPLSVSLDLPQALDEMQTFLAELVICLAERGCAMYEDDYPWPIKCHICLNEFTEQVGNMKAGKELRCPECEVRFVYPVKQFEGELAETYRLGVDPYRGMIRLKKPL